MSLHRGLVRLYPGVFRERWGEALEEDARAAGWRAWPSLAVGIADMWLHPAIWPADHHAQRRQRAATLAITVAALGALSGRVATAQGARFTSAPGGTWAGNTCTVLFLLGLALVAPLPRPTRAAATALAGRALRRLAAPALVGAGMVAVVRLGAPSLATGPWHHLAVFAYWTTLAAGAVQTCRFFAGLGGTVVAAPPSGRLRLGLWSLTAAGVLTGSVVLAASAARQTPDHIAVAAGAALVLLAWALTATLRDLRSVATD
ncbi:hypothetical protein [Kitasatospora sp. HPMI-4]|uniref:hypothetical protein n=1 Tax=Kitasatospora sp. HPMI-4 TaxID=3448443 RepID=UPI003F1E1549